ncbi:MAG: hypothetical protein V1824_04180 [archaeon]
MRQLLKKPTIIIWLILVLLSLFLLATKGLQYGVDFKGGTIFNIILEHPVSSDDMQKITSVISTRLDWAGLKDAKVTFSGDQYVSAQLAESDVKEITRLKETLLRQGKFEARMQGDILFTGDQVLTVNQNPQSGFGIREIKKNSQYSWDLPFMLSQQAAESFATKTFHKCSAGSTTNSENYDCEKTFFFVDCPSDSIIVIDKELYLEEKAVLVSPENPTSETMPIEDILAEVNSSYYIVDSNLSAEDITKLNSDVNKFQKAIVSPLVSENVKNKLKDLGYKVIVKEKITSNPWIWDATGLKSIISLTPGVANMDAPTTTSPRFQKFTNLSITGSTNSSETAKERLDDLVMLLESGSLPIAIESISTESVSPTLGSEFLNNSMLIAIVALITVSLVVFIRYRRIMIAIPVLITSFSEVLILLGFLALINYRLDLAAIAGVLAAIGTGVDHQIVITDELLKGKKEENATGSFFSQIKRAFFIVFTATATTIATMIPIIFFSMGLSKLVGFAITIIAGSLIGVLITRPTYAEVAKKIFSK